MRASYHWRRNLLKGYQLFLVWEFKKKRVEKIESVADNMQWQDFANETKLTAAFPTAVVFGGCIIHNYKFECLLIKKINYVIWKLSYFFTYARDNISEKKCVKDSIVWTIYFPSLVTSLPVINLNLHVCLHHKKKY